MVSEGMTVNWGVYTGNQHALREIEKMNLRIQPKIPQGGKDKTRNKWSTKTEPTRREKPPRGRTVNGLQVKRRVRKGGGQGNVEPNSVPSASVHRRVLSQGGGVQVKRPTSTGALASEKQDNPHREEITGTRAKQ